MPDVDTSPAFAAQHTRVFAARDFFVTSGANMGDGLDMPDPPCEGDVYELDPDAGAFGLSLAQPEAGQNQQVAPGSEESIPGSHIDL